MSSPLRVTYPARQRHARTPHSEPYPGYAFRALRLLDLTASARRVKSSQIKNALMSHMLNQLYQHALFTIFGMHKGNQRVVNTWAGHLVNEFDTPRA